MSHPEQPQQPAQPSGTPQPEGVHTPAAPAAPAGIHFTGASEPQPAAPQPKSRKRAIIVGTVVVGLLAAGGVGAAVASNVMQRGAGSAEEAMKQFDSSLREKKLLDLAKVIAPSELDSFVKRAPEFLKDSGYDVNMGREQKAKPEEVAKRFADAINIKDSQLEYTVSERSAQIATANVTSWNLDVEVDKAKLTEAMKVTYKEQMGSEMPQDQVDEFTKSLGKSELKYNGDVLEKSDGILHFGLVKEDGRWFVSPTVSVAESVYRAALDKGRSRPLGEPNYAADIEGAKGADAPAQAVSGLVDSALKATKPSDLLSDDVTRHLALPERRLAMVYGPLLKAEDRSASERAIGEEVKIDWKLGEHKINGELAAVNLGSTSIEADGGTVTFDDGKVSWSAPSSSTSSPSSGTFDYGRLIENKDRLGFAVVKEHGTWRVSALDSLYTNILIRPNDEAVAAAKPLYAKMIESSQGATSTPMSAAPKSWDELTKDEQRIMGLLGVFEDYGKQMEELTGRSVPSIADAPSLGDSADGLDSSSELYGDEDSGDGLDSDHDTGEGF